MMVHAHFVFGNQLFFIYEINSVVLGILLSHIWVTLDSWPKEMWFQSGGW